MGSGEGSSGESIAVGTGISSGLLVSVQETQTNRRSTRKGFITFPTIEDSLLSHAGGRVK
mgnify:FL=1